MLNNGTTIIFKAVFALLLVYSDAQVNINSDFNVKPQCKDSSAILCENVASYPYDNLTENLNKRNKIIPIAEYNQYEDEEDHKDSLCDTTVDLITPKSGITINNTTMYILNIENQYTQKVRIVKCVGKSSTCKNVVNVGGHESHCQQRYTYQRLIAFDRFYQTSTELFKIPSGCCCSTKTDLDISE